MPTYLIKSEKQLIRQEGDTAQIVITVPAALSLTGYACQFQVYNNQGLAIIDKSTAANTITVVSQTITIPLMVTDTKGKSGKYFWELQLTKASPIEVITIGKGSFTILPERIK